MRRNFTLTVVRRRAWVCLCILAWAGCSTLLSAASRCEPETLQFEEMMALTSVSPEHATDVITGMLPPRQIRSLGYELLLRELPEPVWSGIEEQSLQWSYEDSYQAIDCAVEGFTGPFALEKWKIPEEKGDGGVNVTGALDVLLVEGANKTFLKAVPERATVVSTVVPVGGYATFDWKVVEGSTFSSNDSFLWRVNGRARSISRPGRMEGRFYSRSLKAGDQLELVLSGDDAIEVALFNFRFASSAQGVIERTWRATTSSGQQVELLQYIELIRPAIGDLHFPDDVEADSNILPEVTGFPWIAGEVPMTLDARVPGYFVGYEDESVDQSIIRHWWIEDNCSGNVIRSEQTISLKQPATPTRWVATEPWRNAVVVHRKGL